MLRQPVAVFYALNLSTSVRATRDLSSGQGHRFSKRTRWRDLSLSRRTRLWSRLTSQYNDKREDYAVDDAIVVRTEILQIQTWQTQWCEQCIAMSCNAGNCDQSADTQNGLVEAEVSQTTVPQ